VEFVDKTGPVQVLFGYKILTAFLLEAEFLRVLLLGRDHMP